MEFRCNEAQYSNKINIIHIIIDSSLRLGTTQNLVYFEAFLITSLKMIPIH